MSDSIATGDTLESKVAGPLAPGTMLGEYRVLREIGRGGMGAVFAGVQPEIEKKVAIKVLKPELAARPGMSERFLAEARAVNRIGNPNIVDIFAFGRLPDGTPYFVMEFLAGETLAARLKRGNLKRHELTKWLRELCGALIDAHRAGIVHRDLKPDNIWLVADRDGSARVKLLDFGIAKELDSESHLTRPGEAMGTIDYMAPEQSLGQPVDVRADIYALGVMLYLIAAGTLPFKGNSQQHVAIKHLTEPPPPPSAHRAVPAALERLILDCLQKQPEARPATMAAVWDRLERALGELPDTIDLRAPAVPDSGRETAVTPDDDDDAPGTSSSRRSVGPASDLPAPAAKPARRGRALILATGGGVAIAAIVAVRLLGPASGPHVPSVASPIANDAAAATAQAVDGGAGAAEAGGARARSSATAAASEKAIDGVRDEGPEAKSPAIGDRGVSGKRLRHRDEHERPPEAARGGEGAAAGPARAPAPVAAKSEAQALAAFRARQHSEAAWKSNAKPADEAKIAQTERLLARARADDPRLGEYRLYLGTLYFGQCFELKLRAREAEKKVGAAGDGAEAAGDPDARELAEAANHAFVRAVENFVAATHVRDFPRADEVLYRLGVILEANNMGERATGVLNRLLRGYPDSKWRKAVFEEGGT